jgi:hypothetical protein
MLVALMMILVPVHARTTRLNRDSSMTNSPYIPMASLMIILIIFLMVLLMMPE